MAEEDRRLTGRLELKGVSLRLKLGLHDFERIHTRTVPVDITRTGELFADGKPFLDYSLLVDTLESRLRDEYLYIEELAADVLQLLKERWDGTWRVTVRKPEPHLSLRTEEASVTVEG